MRRFDAPCKVARCYIWRDMHAKLAQKRLVTILDSGQRFAAFGGQVPVAASCAMPSYAPARRAAPPPRQSRKGMVRARMESSSEESEEDDLVSHTSQPRHPHFALHRERTRRTTQACARRRARRLARGGHQHDPYA